VAFLCATPETDTFRVRQVALATHLASGGASLVEADRLVSDVDAGAAHAAALASMPALVAAGVTAVVCATDLHAYGFLRACAERGIAVPSEMSVAGFDDQPLSAYVSPPLTTVAFPADELGREAGRMLADLIARGVTADPVPSSTGAPDGDRPALAARVLPVALVVRGSTGTASR
jgi:DNA-binding LacI/PurR family transcriptional regulator